MPILLVSVEVQNAPANIQEGFVENDVHFSPGIGLSRNRFAISLMQLTDLCQPAFPCEKCVAIRGDGALFLQKSHFEEVDGLDLRKRDGTRLGLGVDREELDWIPARRRTKRHDLELLARFQDNDIVRGERNVARSLQCQRQEEDGRVHE